jgi:hypothetical protein
MHDVEGQLPVINALGVHAKPLTLHGEHGSFAQDHYSPPTELQGNALSTAAAGTIFLKSGGTRSKAVSASFSKITLPGGPFSDCPVNVITRLMRSFASRPCLE